MDTDTFTPPADDTRDGEPARPLPTVVRIGSSPRMSANEMRALRALTGKTLSDLMADEVDATQALVWVALYRAGHRPTWDQAGAVEADMSPEAPDPTVGAS